MEYDNSNYNRPLFWRSFFLFRRGRNLFFAWRSSCVWKRTYSMSRSFALRISFQCKPTLIVFFYNSGHQTHIFLDSWAILGPGANLNSLEVIPNGLQIRSTGLPTSSRGDWPYVTARDLRVLGQLHRPRNHICQV